MNDRPYDCTEDVKKHQERVRRYLDRWADLLKERAQRHDESKLTDPIEKALFDHWTPELRRLTFGTDEYKLALEGMGEGVQRHYQANRHHPEHYKNGVNGMTLVDIMEMAADWIAAAERNNSFVDLDNATKRFELSEQLVKIIINTLQEEDLWNEINGVPSSYLTPPNKRKDHTETPLNQEAK